MLYEEANKRFEKIYEQNDVPDFIRGDLYKDTVRDFLKEDFKLEDKDFDALNWKGDNNTSFEYGDALLKYADLKVWAFEVSIV